MLRVSNKIIRTIPQIAHIYMYIHILNGLKWNIFPKKLQRVSYNFFCSVSFFLSRWITSKAFPTTGRVSTNESKQLIGRKNKLVLCRCWMSFHFIVFYIGKATHTYKHASAFVCVPMSVSEFCVSVCVYIFIYREAVDSNRVIVVDNLEWLNQKSFLRLTQNKTKEWYSIDRCSHIILILHLKCRKMS